MMPVSTSPHVSGSGTGIELLICREGAIAGLLFAAAPSFDQNPRNEVGLVSRSLFSIQPSLGAVPSTHACTSATMSAELQVYASPRMNEVKVDSALSVAEKFPPCKSFPPELQVVEPKNA